MATGTLDLPIENNESAGRFEVRLGESMAFLQYRVRGQDIVLLHTEVPPQFTHHGIAGELVRTALEFARAKGLTVVPVCPYVVGYIEKHPEYASLVKPGKGTSARPLGS